jgi:hypothetical protein
MFEDLVVDGELTPELLKVRNHLSQSLEAALEKIDSNRLWTWVEKQRYSAELQKAYEDTWEKHLTDAGYVVRPVFEDLEEDLAEDWYEELNKINEWVDAKGNKVSAGYSTSTVSTTSSATTKSSTKKRPKVKTVFGVAESWEDEFIKLDNHLRTVNPLPASDRDRRITPTLLRTYWVDKQGLERRLEVTTTEMRNFKSYEKWDYVLSVEDNGEKIISRGYIKDYEALLDILLKTGDIADKSKCI